MAAAKDTAPAARGRGPEGAPCAAPGASVPRPDSAPEPGDSRAQRAHAGGRGAGKGRSAPPAHGRPVNGRRGSPGRSPPDG